MFELERLTASMDTLIKTVESLTIENKNSKDTVKNLESKFKMVSLDAHLYDSSASSVVVDRSLLPEKFSANDIPKFQAMDNPHFHIKAFETIMALKKIDKKLFPSMFALSLDHVPQKWFFKQEPANITTWDDVKRLFIARY